MLGGFKIQITQIEHISSSLFGSMTSPILCMCIQKWLLKLLKRVMMKGTSAGTLDRGVGVVVQAL